jgi:arginine utilization regulatory protein
MDYYRELLDILISYVGEGIHVIDKNGRTVIYNRAMEGLEGLESHEVLGKKLLEVFPSLDENTSTLCRTLNSGEYIFERYQSYINKKGYNITAVNTTIPIVRNEEILGAVEISKDFTKVKELYDRIINLTNIGEVKTKDSSETTFENIIGCSPKFLRVLETAGKAAKSSSSVLIYGETGTGKEVLTRCIHNESDRKKGPFVAVNCAALPEGLLEGILFGTVKGGFTGALNRPGLFEQAFGGTILLDEINSMSVSLQAKLLRVLQEGYVRRIGDVKDIKLDVKIIATTNEDPYTAIVNNSLRKDLYYRLSVINITIPALRDRKEDIPLFIKEFIRRYNNEFSKDAWDVSRDVYDAFMSYSWPGNVRELKNYIEGAMNMVTGHILTIEHFSPQVQETLFAPHIIQSNKKEIEDFKFEEPLDKYIDDIEKDIIIKALSKCNNNISEASRVLKIKRQTLQHKMKKYKLQ